jgi:hypothetical protein
LGGFELGLLAVVGLPHTPRNIDDERKVLALDKCDSTHRVCE